jgi:hypothetical protein
MDPMYARRPGALRATATTEDSPQYAPEKLGVWRSLATLPPGSVAGFACRNLETRS